MTYIPLPEGMSYPTDLLASSFENVALSLSDLIKARLVAGQPTIKGVSFTRCLIEGPAVMLVVGGCKFVDTNFGDTTGDPRSLVLRPASPSKVIGAAGVEDCTFTGCQFMGVGFTGAEGFLDQLLKMG
jgi:uncharacterized protein YjbI with pentapeptide repeats